MDRRAPWKPEMAVPKRRDPARTARDATTAAARNLAHRPGLCSRPARSANDARRHRVQDQSPDTASPNGVPSESRHTDQASPGWITLPPSPRPAPAQAPCRPRRSTAAMQCLPARGLARGSRPRALRRGFDARSPPARRDPRDGDRAALPTNGAPARRHPRGTRSATTAGRRLGKLDNTSGPRPEDGRHQLALVDLGRVAHDLPLFALGHTVRLRDSMSRSRCGATNHPRTAERHAPDGPIAVPQAAPIRQNPAARDTRRASALYCRLVESAQRADSIGRRRGCRLGAEAGTRS